MCSGAAVATASFAIHIRDCMIDSSSSARGNASHIIRDGTIVIHSRFSLAESKSSTGGSYLIGSATSHPMKH